MNLSDYALPEYSYLIGKTKKLPEQGCFYSSYHGFFSDIPRSKRFITHERMDTKGVKCRIEGVYKHIHSGKAIACVDIIGKDFHTFVDVKDLEDLK